MSGRGLTNQWESWQRLIDSIGPYYRTQLFAARDRARGELRDLDEEQLELVAAEGRTVAGSLDEEGARVTVDLTEDREWHSRLAADLQREAEVLLRRRRWAVASRHRRQARAERTDRAEEHRRLAAQAHEQLRELGNSGRHLHPWFERHKDVLARGMAAELTLDAAQGAVYHVLGAPGIASLTAACLTTDRTIAIGELERLVMRDGDARQRLLFEVAAELYGHEQGVSLMSCSPSSTAKTWTGCSRRSRCSSGGGARLRDRRTISGYAPPNRTRNPAAEADRFPTGSPSRRRRSFAQGERSTPLGRRDGAGYGPSAAVPQPQSEPCGESDRREIVTDLLKPSEVARMLQVSRTWLYDAAKDGRIPSVRLGGPDGPVRFIEEDIEQWLERARQAWRPGESSAQTLRRARRAA